MARSQALRVERNLDGLDRLVPKPRPVPQRIARVQVTLGADQKEVRPQEVLSDAVDSVVHRESRHEGSPLEERLKRSPPRSQLYPQTLLEYLVRFTLDRNNLLSREYVPQHEISERIKELLLLFAQHEQLLHRTGETHQSLTLAPHSISRA